MRTRRGGRQRRRRGKPRQPCPEVQGKEHWEREGTSIALMVMENVYCICEIKVAGDFGKAVSDEGWGGKADRVSEGRPGVGTNSSQQEVRTLQITRDAGTSLNHIEVQPGEYRQMSSEP